MKNFKTAIMMIAAIILSTVVTACSGNQNQNRDATQSVMSPMMTSYMEINDALVSDNSENASKAAKTMLEMPEMNDAMKSKLQGIAGSNDLKEQRKHFSELSEEMYQMAKNGDMGETMYWNHCPMAMDGKGANWLSMNKKINNPYMGQKMPGCGSVQETLSKK